MRKKETNGKDKKRCVWTTGASGAEPSSCAPVDNRGLYTKDLVVTVVCISFLIQPTYKNSRFSYGRLAFLLEPSRR